MATDVSKTDITLEEMTPDTLDPDMFKKLLALSVSIFEPDKPEAERSPASQLSNWQELFSKPESILFYALDDAKQPVGLFFVESRVNPEIGYRLPHVWIACVDPKSRGLGLFPRLTEKTKAHATGLGYAEITVCTYPQQFTKMYRILCQNGWQEVCWLIEGEKVLMKLPL